MASALAKQLALRSKLKRSNRAVLPAVEPTANLEVAYRRELRKLVDALVRATKAELLDPLINQDASPSEAIRTFLAKIAGQFVPAKKAQEIALRMVGKVDVHNRNKLIEAFRREIGIDVRSLLAQEGLDKVFKEAVKTNVELIQSIPTEYHSKLSAAIRANQTGELTGAALANRIEELGDITYRRAELIARDQIATINAKISEARQSALGIEEYIWVTSGDERVRESHADKDGQTFRWDDPPADTGHPGEDILCRCIARPVINLEEL